MLKVHQQSRAEKDLEDIWLYSFETHGERQVDKYYDALIEGMNSPATNPNLGISCDEIRKGYRWF